MHFQAQELDRIGHVYRQLRNFPEALKHFNKALEHHNREKNPKEEKVLGMILYNIGNTNLLLGKVDESIDYLFQSLDIENRQNPQNQKRRSKVVNTIGKVYLMQKNFDKAEVYLKEYLTFESKLENPNVFLMSVQPGSYL